MIGEIQLIAIDALDKLSRYRALDEVESYTLERLIRTQESSMSGMARLTAWRAHGLIMAMQIPDLDAQVAPGVRKLVLRVMRDAA